MTGFSVLFRCFQKVKKPIPISDKNIMMLDGFNLPAIARVNSMTAGNAERYAIPFMSIFFLVLPGL